MKPLVVLCSFLISISFASAEPIVVIVRHAEKAANDPKDPDLSAAGRTRAEALAKILKDANITAIFATEFKRTQETAAPISKSAGVVPIIIGGKDIAGLVSKLRQLNGNALVVGHGDTVPDIVKALGIDASIQISDGDYTEIFVVELGDKPQSLRLHYPQ
jgi:broad specificity phosphatase PhoE